MAPDAICSICLESLLTGKDELMQELVPVVWKACGHTFHQTCSDMAIQQDRQNFLAEHDVDSVCPSCPTCRAVQPNCPQCGGTCTPPYSRLFLQTDDEDTDAFAALRTPSFSTQTLFNLAAVAREARVDVEELQKRMKELWRADGVDWVGWSEVGLRELVQSNRDGFVRVVRGLQREAGLQHLETLTLSAKAAFNHFTNTISFIPLIDDQFRLIQALRQDSASALTEATRLPGVEAKLRVAEAKLGKWEEEKRQEIEAMREAWRGKEAGMTLARQGLQARVESLNREKWVIEQEYRNFVREKNQQALRASSTLAVTRKELADAKGALFVLQGGVFRKQVATAELQKEVPPLPLPLPKTLAAPTLPPLDATDVSEQNIALKRQLEIWKERAREYTLDWNSTPSSEPDFRPVSGPSRLRVDPLHPGYGGTQAGPSRAGNTSTNYQLLTPDKFPTHIRFGSPDDYPNSRKRRAMPRIADHPDANPGSPSEKVIDLTRSSSSSPTSPKLGAPRSAWGLAVRRAGFEGGKGGRY